MKIVIQCANGKHGDAGYLKTPSGQRVVFVAHPEKCTQSQHSCLCCRPEDEIAPGQGTWREYLVRYNQRGTNPDGLYRAADLYRPSMPSIYQDIVGKCGWKNVFILSAGWGLIRSDYPIPYYDITFSSQGKPWSRRGQNDHYKDFVQLEESDISPDESVYLFASKGYLRLYYSLMQNLKVRKVIYGTPGSHEGYEYVPYRTFTNWQYSCARDFIEDKIPK